MNFAQRSWILPAIVATLVVACGGGGGGGGGQSPVTGLSKTTHVTGAISGFGSVIVNGVRYESDSATVTIDGHPGTVSDLKVGQVIHLKSETDAQGKPNATSIEEDRLVQGVVEAVDLAAGTLTVAGQVIRVDDATSFDTSIPGGTLAGIVVGDHVEVHGFVSSSGDALATRIEKADASDNEIEVTGPLSGLDTVAMRFSVGTQVVDYTTATLEGFPVSGLAEGDIVEVKGTTLLGDGALKAVAVHKENGELDGESGDGGEIEGLVTRFVSATDFDVAGQKVTTTGATSFVGGTAGDLTMDARVEVEGKLDSSGTLVADKVVFKHESTVKLSAAVDDVTVDSTDPTRGTVKVLGLTFIVTADTRKEDDESDNHFFSIADVHPGDWVELSGYSDPASSGNLIATRLEKHGAGDMVELKGPADQLSAPDSSFKILGVSVVTTPETTFSNGDAPMTSADFFATAAGQRVEVEGTWDGTLLHANEVQIDGTHGESH